MTFDLKHAIKHTEAVAAAAKEELGCVAVFVYAIWRDGDIAHQTSATSGGDGIPVKLTDLIRAHLKEIER